MDCGQKIVAKDAKNLEQCPVCGSDDLATFSRVIGYVKMIARKSIKLIDGYYKGEFNFWSKARRFDWAQRKRFTKETTKDADNINDQILSKTINIYVRS
jgi:ribonucleoside-triphosphate reductase